MNVTRYLDFPLICLTCISVFVYRGGLDGLFGMVLVSIAIVILIFEIVFTYKNNNIDTIKSDWCKRWNEVKLEERERLA